MLYLMLMQESMGLFFLVLAVSLVVTLFVYGAFPIAFAKWRKNTITKRKYRIICYAVNFIGIVLFVAVDGGASGGPYLLWTSVFSYLGIRILNNRGILSDPLEEDEEAADLDEDEEQICFCRKCGSALEDDSRFCRKCGTEIKEVEQ